MLTAIIPTRNSEKRLLPTLAALVPGAAASVVREVIVADGRSADGTGLIADAAGCTMLVSAAPLEARLQEAVRAARAPWLLFLRAGTVPEPGWIAEVSRFIEETELMQAEKSRAASFRPGRGAGTRPLLVEALALAKAAFAGVGPDQGLLIHRSLYGKLGGHAAPTENTEQALLSRIGRRRLTLLRTGALRMPDAT